MSEVKIFENENFGQVRTVTIDNDPWFIGKDVADILGYSNSRKAIADHVDEEDKTDGVTIRDAIGRDQNPILINESGVYSLIFSSKLPAAKEFKHWVTAEVIPSIRKYGGYIAGQEEASEDELLEKALMVATRRLAEREKKLSAATDEIKRLNEENKIQAQQIQEMTPKTTYYDIVLNCVNPIPTKVISKDYGWSAQQLNKYLHDKHVQYKTGDIWLLYQEHANKGYTKTKTSYHVNSIGQYVADVYTYWTQAGRLFIYDLLKADGILPIIENETTDDDYDEEDYEDGNLF